MFLRFKFLFENTKKIVTNITENNLFSVSDLIFFQNEKKTIILPSDLKTFQALLFESLFVALQQKDFCIEQKNHLIA